MRRANKLAAQKKGGSNKKMKKYPRILDYLEAHHPQVYELIEDLAMHGNLTPRRGGSITFLLPDASYIKEIKKAAESDEPEKATDMISSLILLDLFEKPEDFAGKKENIANLLEKKLVVKSITSSKVLIDNGELTLDVAFKPFGRQGNAKRGNMAVWKLSGKVEYEKAPVADVKFLRASKKEGSPPIKGGNDTNNEIKLIKGRIIDDKLRAVSEDKKGADGNKYCPIINAVTRLIRVFGDKNDPTYYEEYRRAKCILTMCPMIDFYILFCDPLIFSYDRVLSAYKKGVDIDNNVDTYREFCNNYDHPALKDDPALLFKADSISAIHDARDQVRSRIMSKITKDVGDKISKVYQNVDSTNSIEGQGPLYARGLADIFSKNKGLHLFLDEFSHMVYVYLTEEVMMGPTPFEKASRLKNMVLSIQESYGDFTNPEKKTKLDKPDSYGVTLDNSGIYQSVIYFWKVWGLRLPCNESTEFEDRIKTGGDDDPLDKDLVDVDSDIQDHLDTFSNCPCQLSDTSLAEMKAYMKSHGNKLPPGLE